MSTRKHQRKAAKYHGQWEYRFRIGKTQIVYIGGNRRFNQATRRMFGDGFACPAYTHMFHNGGRP